MSISKQVSKCLFQGERASSYHWEASIPFNEVSFKKKIIEQNTISRIVGYLRECKHCS